MRRRSAYGPGNPSNSPSSLFIRRPLTGACPRAYRASIPQARRSRRGKESVETGQETPKNAKIGGRTTMLTRRGFVAGSAAALLGGAGGASAQPTPRVRVIDIHAHWYPPDWVALMERAGDANGARIGRNARGHVTAAIPNLSVTFQPHYVDIASRLQAMDKAGVAMHALSLTQPMVFWAAPAFGLDLCRTFNDACVAVHGKYPDRFVGLAMLPMQDTSLAVQEFDRVEKLAGIRGVY